MEAIYVPVEGSLEVDSPVEGTGDNLKRVGDHK